MQLARKNTSAEITIELIMSKISEYDVYRSELGDFTIGRSISNPMRLDENPSMCVYMSSSGHLFHKDYADDRFAGGCIDLVCQKYGLNYDKALQKVAKDFGIKDAGSEEYKKIISQYVKPVLDMKMHSLIHVSVRKWEKADLDYWKQFGITIDHLRGDDVYCVKSLSINRRKVFIRPGELCFVYRYAEGFKVYFPLRSKEDGKWKSNITTRTVENLKALNGATKVLITKAKKDRMCLQAIFPDLAIISVQNETRSCFTEEFVNALKGKEVWINYDSDEAGVKNCQALTADFGYKYINVPKQYLPIKDFADLYKEEGAEPIINYFKKRGLI